MLRRPFTPKTNAALAKALHYGRHIQKSKAQLFVPTSEEPGVS